MDVNNILDTIGTVAIATVWLGSAACLVGGVVVAVWGCFEI